MSKLLFSIQSFTYTCCSEAAEARRLFHDSPASDVPSVLSKFGIGVVLLGGDLLLLPESISSVDDGFQPFDGRLGKLRYLGLALMAAASPVSKEVVQLCMSFPAEVDPFDFDVSEHSSIKRAPVAYPILCGHILTHTTGALIAIAGRARAEEGKYSVNSVVEDCRNIAQIGLIARVSQVILARLRPHFGDDPVWEQQIHSILQNSMAVNSVEDKWSRFGVSILCALLSPEVPAHTPHLSQADADRMCSQVMQAVESAKVEAISFLRDLSLVCQVLIPNIFSSSSHDDQCQSSTALFDCYMELFHIENLDSMLKSNLLQKILSAWYADATGKNTNNIDFPRIFTGRTWPVTGIKQHGPTQPDEMPPSCLPLLGNNMFTERKSENLQPRISFLPKSYTDLYAQLSEMCPDSEQTALCLVCGQVRSKCCSIVLGSYYSHLTRLVPCAPSFQVLNAGGKSECTKHSYKCGGGAGIYFLVQECVGLIMHGQKAAYVHSPYVDFYGETPQYRGRPLNLDLDRYRILQSLWSGHSVREKVIAERASTRQVIIPNFY